MEFSKMNERTRYLSCGQGFCARNISEGSFNYMLITPPPRIHIR